MHERCSGKSPDISHPTTRHAEPGQKSLTPALLVISSASVSVFFLQSYNSLQQYAHRHTPSSQIRPANMTRTLLLAPPSISAHPEVLDKVYEIHDRSSTDLQMLDRIAAGLVQLPSSTYDVVLFLTDADGTTRESHKLLGRVVMNKVVSTLKAGGFLKSQDGVFGSTGGAEKTEAILAGLIDGAEGMMKPQEMESVSIPLKLRKKTNGNTNGVNSSGPEALNMNGKRDQPEPVKPVGVGFVDFSDDLDDPIVTGEDDDLIDEDDLITEEDMARPVIQRM